MSLADIRDGLAANLGTLSGIRVYEEVPDNPALPCAVIQLDQVEYDVAFQRGATQYTFIVNLVVTRTTVRRAQRKLDEFIDDGSKSVKTAIESDGSLGGAAFDVRVEAVRDIAPVTIGDIQYMAVDFTVTVFAL
jgi:hypothetical protein